MERIKAILFDKDGTLVDFNRTWGPAAHAVVSRLANGNAAHLAGLMDAVGFVAGTTNLTMRSAVVSDATPVFARHWATLIEREATPEFFAEIDRMFAEEVMKSLSPLPFVAATLAALGASGLSLGVGTNDAEANARQQIRGLGLDHLLPFIAGYDSGHGAKPSPGMVLAFARHVGVAPQEVAMVGDTLHDIEAAKAAGARSVAVLTGLTGEGAREQLAPHADIVIRSLDELAGAIF
ncbi:HAD family hydrolase [Terrarubrum flagellatum]|uniref:HAD family hydrolase n=1 Tax=Terrirubrum flagellatum TaxID=2895980 RepID=UPI00314534DE